MFRNLIRREPLKYSYKLNVSLVKEFEQKLERKLTNKELKFVEWIVRQQMDTEKGRAYEK